VPPDDLDRLWQDHFGPWPESRRRWE
jgi:hypothetical protein